jgi:hypothetical protein
MKSLAHRLWFLLFAAIGTALLALLLLLYGTAPAVKVWIVPLRFLLLGPAIAGAYIFAIVVAIADWLSPDASELYLLSIRDRVLSKASLFWAAIKVSWSLFLLAAADLLWLAITVYYSAGSYFDLLDAFADRFGMLLGLVNVLLVVKIFTVYAYGSGLPRWQVAMAEGLVSLSMAATLGLIMLVAPFDGVLPFLLVLAQKLVVGAFFFLQAMDAISRLSRALEFRAAERAEAVAIVSPYTDTSF